jgi:hypothetical protein
MFPLFLKLFIKEPTSGLIADYKPELIFWCDLHKINR